MNSYNENLHSTVLTSLQSQELDEKKKKAQLNAAMFSLYYAEGARITASEKLELANDELTRKAAMKEQAVNNSNIATNLLASAKQQETYVSQSVTNTAVSAANIQNAKNAIVKLAGDMGSVFSMVHAADFGGDIYDHSKTAHQLINKTASKAEKASLEAMEATTLTAQISSKAVSQKAQNTHSAIKNLLEVVSTEFDSISTAVNADNAQVAAANTKEKAAEGILEDFNTDYYASKMAYKLTNKELNLNLKAKANPNSNDSYTVSWKRIKSPFQKDSSKPWYPVDDYYIMLVKDEKKSTFNASVAERLSNESTEKKVFMKIQAPSASAKAGTKPHPSKLTETLNISSLHDSDGDELVRGSNYVVFVFATYNREYKKLINNYEEFLSAPSAPFSLTYSLVAADPSTFVITEEEFESKKTTLTGEKESDGVEQGTASESTTQRLSAPQFSTQFTFEMGEKDNKEYQVQYRCMFLPSDVDITKGLLTSAGLRQIATETKSLEKITAEYEPKIAALESQMLDEKIGEEISKLQTKMTNLKAQEQELKDKMNPTSPKDPQPTAAEKKKYQSSLNGILKDLVNTNTKLNKLNEIPNAIVALQKNMKSDLDSLQMDDIHQAGLFFNLTLAENVSAGNYSPAGKPPKKTGSSATDKKAKGTPEKSAPITWAVDLGPQTTDNFGNPLIQGNSYVPVVLTVSTAAEENLKQFTNALSDFTMTEPFVYQKGLIEPIQ